MILWKLEGVGRFTFGQVIDLALDVSVSIAKFVIFILSRKIKDTWAILPQIVEMDFICIVLNWLKFIGSLSCDQRSFFVPLFHLFMSPYIFADVHTKKNEREYSKMCIEEICWTIWCLRKKIRFFEDYSEKRSTEKKWLQKSV